jgi:hypothetical protein
MKERRGESLMSIALERGRHACVLIAALLVVSAAVLGAASGAAAGTVGLVGGGAFGASVNVQPVVGPAVTFGPAPSVTLPSTGGGPFTASLTSIVLPGLLETKAGSVSTQGVFGPSGFVTSSAQVATLSAANGAVKASLVGTSCRIDSAGNTTGTTNFGSLTVLGIPASAGPPANTTVPLPGVGTLTLNEQTSTVGPGGLRSITVNGIHLHLAGALGTGDVIVSQSRCTARI